MSLRFKILFSTWTGDLIRALIYKHIIYNYRMKEILNRCLILFVVSFQELINAIFVFLTDFRES